MHFTQRRSLGLGRQRSRSVVVMVLVLLMAACGGAGTDEAAEETSTTAEVATTTEASPTTSTAPDTVATTMQETGGGLAAVCEAGVDEGSFSYWATFEPDNWERIFEPFSQTYPGISVDFLPLRPQETVQRILTASSAGQDIEVDLINGNLDALQPLVERELVDTTVSWDELDVPGDLIHSTNTVRIYRVPVGLAYNTELTDPADLPDTWEGLVDGAYEQDVVVDPRGNPFSTFALELGEETTIDYVTRLRDTTNPVVIEGGTAGMLAVVGGEVMITAGGRADSNAELQAEGAPVDIKYLDLVPTTDFYHAVMVGSESSNAAQCFAGWLASPEGAAVHEEVEFKANESIPPSAPEGAVVVSVETAEDAELVAGVGEQVADIWGQGG